MRRALDSNPIDAIQMRVYLGLAETDHVELDKPQLSYIADQQMKQAMVRLQEEVVSTGEQQTPLLENALFVARTISELPFDLNLWQAQNLWYDIYLRLYPAIKARTTTNGAKAAKARSPNRSPIPSRRAPMNGWQNSKKSGS